MSIIATTNSTCTIKKIECRGAEAIVHLKITAFARTLPEKGIMIYLKEPASKVLTPAFRVSSEEDVYQNRIFWINTSNLTGHTNQNIGMETTIPVHIDLSRGTYKDGHLYREIMIAITDYQNEKSILWLSQTLHLCSGPLDFNIKGNIMPRFTRIVPTGTSKYSLSIDYKFSEDSWLFNLQHEDLLLEMNVHAKQDSEFNTQEVVLAETFGTWENVSSELEEEAHVTIVAQLKLNQAVIWEDSVVCVPGEISTLYIKKDNNIHIVTHKAVQYSTLTRDTHIYHSIHGSYTLELLITPWLSSDGTPRMGSLNQPLYTISPYVINSYGKYIPIKDIFTLSIAFSKISWNNGEELDIPYNLIEDVTEDFPTIIYNNYSTEIAERILSQMTLLNTFLEIAIDGITATKHPMLIVEATPANYIVGDDAASGLRVGSESSGYSLIIQKGNTSYGK